MTVKTNSMEGSLSLYRLKPDARHYIKAYQQYMLLEGISQDSLFPAVGRHRDCKTLWALEVNSFKVLNEGKSWGAAECAIQNMVKYWLDPWDYIIHDLNDHSFARESWDEVCKPGTETGRELGYSQKLIQANPNHYKTEKKYLNNILLKKCDYQLNQCCIDCTTYLAFTMFPAFNSTISSNPMANMSTGLLLRSVFKY